MALAQNPTQDCHGIGLLASSLVGGKRVPMTHHFRINGLSLSPNVAHAHVGDRLCFTAEKRTGRRLKAAPLDYEFKFEASSAGLELRQPFMLSSAGVGTGEGAVSLTTNFRRVEWTSKALTVPGTLSFVETIHGCGDMTGVVHVEPCVEPATDDDATGGGDDHRVLESGVLENLDDGDVGVGEGVEGDASNSRRRSNNAKRKKKRAAAANKKKEGGAEAGNTDNVADSAPNGDLGSGGGVGAESESGCADLHAFRNATTLGLLVEVKKQQLTVDTFALLDQVKSQQRGALSPLPSASFNISAAASIDSVGSSSVPSSSADDSLGPAVLPPRPAPPGAGALFPPHQHRVVVRQGGLFDPASLVVAEGEVVEWVVGAQVVGSVRLSCPMLGFSSPALYPGQAWECKVPEGAQTPPPLAPRTLNSAELGGQDNRDGGGGRSSSGRSNGGRSSSGSSGEDDFFETCCEVQDLVFNGLCLITVTHSRRCFAALEIKRQQQQQQQHQQYQQQQQQEQKQQQQKTISVCGWEPAVGGTSESSSSFCDSDGNLSSVGRDSGGSGDGCEPRSQTAPAVSDRDSSFDPDDDEKEAGEHGAPSGVADASFAAISRSEQVEEGALSIHHHHHHFHHSDRGDGSRFPSNRPSSPPSPLSSGAQSSGEARGRGSGSGDDDAVAMPPRLAARHALHGSFPTSAYGKKVQPTPLHRPSATMPWVEGGSNSLTPHHLMRRSAQSHENTALGGADDGDSDGEVEDDVARFPTRRRRQRGRAAGGGAKEAAVLRDKQGVGRERGAGGGGGGVDLRCGGGGLASSDSSDFSADDPEDGFHGGLVVPRSGNPHRRQQDQQQKPHQLGNPSRTVGGSWVGGAGGGVSGNKGSGGGSDGFGGGGGGGGGALMSSNLLANHYPLLVKGHLPSVSDGVSPLTSPDSTPQHSPLHSPPHSPTRARTPSATPSRARSPSSPSPSTNHAAATRSTPPSTAAVGTAVRHYHRDRRRQQHSSRRAREHGDGEEERAGLKGGEEEHGALFEAGPSHVPASSQLGVERPPQQQKQQQQSSMQILSATAASAAASAEFVTFAVRERGAGDTTHSPPSAGRSSRAAGAGRGERRGERRGESGGGGCQARESEGRGKESGAGARSLRHAFYDDSAAEDSDDVSSLSSAATPASRLNSSARTRELQQQPARLDGQRTFVLPNTPPSAQRAGGASFPATPSPLGHSLNGSLNGSFGNLGGTSPTGPAPPTWQAFVGTPSSVDSDDASSTSTASSGGVSHHSRQRRSMEWPTTLASSTSVLEAAAAPAAAAAATRGAFGAKSTDAACLSSVGDCGGGVGGSGSLLASRSLESVLASEDQAAAEFCDNLLGPTSPATRHPLGPINEAPPSPTSPPTTPTIPPSASGDGDDSPLSSLRRNSAARSNSDGSPTPRAVQPPRRLEPHPLAQEEKVTAMASSAPSPSAEKGADSSRQPPSSPPLRGSFWRSDLQQGAALPLGVVQPLGVSSAITADPTESVVVGKISVGKVLSAGDRREELARVAASAEDELSAAAEVAALTEELAALEEAEEAARLSRNSGATAAASTAAGEEINQWTPVKGKRKKKKKSAGADLSEVAPPLRLASRKASSLESAPPLALPPPPPTPPPQASPPPPPRPPVAVVPNLPVAAALDNASAVEVADENPTGQKSRKNRKRNKKDQTASKKVGDSTTRSDYISHTSSREWESCHVEHRNQVISVDAAAVSTIEDVDALVEIRFGTGDDDEKESSVKERNSGDAGGIDDVKEEEKARKLRQAEEEGRESGRLLLEMLQPTAQRQQDYGSEDNNALSESAAPPPAEEVGEEFEGSWGQSNEGDCWEEEEGGADWGADWAEDGNEEAGDGAEDEEEDAAVRVARLEGSVEDFFASRFAAVMARIQSGLPDVLPGDKSVPFEIIGLAGGR